MRIPLETAVPAATLTLLFTAAIKATVLLSLAWIATRAMHRAPAAARHLVWTFALVGALGLPLATLMVPAWPLAWVPALTSGGGNIAPPSTMLGSLDGTTPPTETLTPIHDPKQDGAETKALTDASEPDGADAGIVSRVTDERDRSDAAPSASAPAHTSPVPPGHAAFDPRTLLRWLPLVWLAGALLVLGRRAIAAFRVSALRRRAKPVTDPAWRAALARHATSLGIAPVPALLMSDEADVPMTFGMVRPVVLVPADAFEWTPARRDFVLLHELGHIRRRDTLALLIGQLTAALYWFHPLVWVAKRRQRAEAEHACDDQVLQSGALASAYARELLELATAARGHDTYGAAALAMARRSQLEGRLLTILDPRPRRGSAGRRFLLGALVLTVAATGALAAARPALKKASESPDSEPATVTHVSAMPPSTSAVDANLEAQPTYGPDLNLAPAFTGDLPQAVAQTVTASVTTSATSSVSSSVTSAVTSSVSTSTGGAEVADGANEVAAAVSNAVLAAASAKSSGKSHSSFSIQEHDGEVKVTSGNWIDDDGGDATYKSKGDVEFNDELDDVRRISAGGSLTVELEKNGRRWRAEFKPQAGGIQRTFWVDGDRREWDDTARQWFADFLVATDRHSAMLAKQRYPKLMAAGGTKRVLDEIAQMPSDYAQGVYYRMLVEDGISKEDLRRVVAQAGRDVESDYELGRILGTAAAKGALQDPATRQIFLEAVQNIESDYEHARVLMLVLERPRLDPPLAADALRSVASINSDYERSRILVTMAEKGSVAPAIQRDYIRTAAAIKSDYEKARSLKSLTNNAEIADENVAPLLAATSSIRSDYEKAGVLVGIAESVQLDKNARAAFIDTAQGIRSDYERKRALSALGVKSASY